MKPEEKSDRGTLADFQKRPDSISSQVAASTPEDLYSPAALRGPGILDIFQRRL